MARACDGDGDGDKPFVDDEHPQPIALFHTIRPAYRRSITPVSE